MPRAKPRKNQSACNIQIDDDDEADEEAGLLSDRDVDRWERDCKPQAPSMAAFEATMAAFERGVRRGDIHPSRRADRGRGRATKALAAAATVIIVLLVAIPLHRSHCHWSGRFTHQAIEAVAEAPEISVYA